MKKLTVQQAGSLGGKKRWHKKTKKEKSEAMRDVANARWQKTAPKEM